MDYAATTPLEPRARKAMEPYFAKTFANPGALYAEAVAAKKAVETARAKIARALEAHSDEIVFTSGGTEANNLAIFGGVPREKFLPHIITTNIEHSSVLEPLRELARRGEIDVSYISVEPDGIVKPEKIISAIRPNTALVSVQYANNEIGTIQPIAKIGKALRELKHRPLFHVDACQAPLYLNCLVNALGVDMLSLDAHKIYGPKGVGCLYVRRGVNLAPVLYGGGQERGVRSTTENVPGIVGFGEAISIAISCREKESVRASVLRDLLYTNVLPSSSAGRQNTAIRKDGKIIVNGSMKKDERLPNNLNISLPGVDTEMLVLKLDAEGIAVSTKSSCLKDERESYVVKSLNNSQLQANSTLRFTLGKYNTKKDIEYAAKILLKLIK